MADALPALGIVAAVLGVIKTMSHINEPPAVLGAMIGGALVGTFLGVLLAYGMVGPFATRLKGVVEEEGEVSGGDSRGAGGASARQCAAGERRDRPQDGAQRSTCRASLNSKAPCKPCISADRGAAPEPPLIPFPLTADPFAHSREAMDLMRPGSAGYGIRAFCVRSFQPSDSLRHFSTWRMSWGGRLERLVILGMLVARRWAAR